MALPRFLVAAAVLLAAAGVACGEAPHGDGAAATPVTTPAGQPAQLAVQVMAVYPHDAGAFTQGLLLHDGALYESTGLYGQSSLRRVALTTGEVGQRVDLAPVLFGEGLALAGGRLFQITWRERLALVYDLAFQKVGSFTYEGEGWGLCFDGDRLIMSDGSARLAMRDPLTFAVTSHLDVQRAGRPAGRLNELECVGDDVYANLWPTDRIAVIDKHSGAVRAEIDTSDLLTAAERQAIAHEAVLNGIAYDEQTRTFLITGKLWPKLFRVRFVPRP